MNKTLTIVTALLVLAFIGYFATNQIVSNKASEEIERLAGPKLQELGVQYSDLRVNPAGGSLTLRNVQIDEAYAEELTVKASHKDLLELMGGESMFLHGLEVEVANVRLSDNRGREGLEIGQGKADIDALLTSPNFNATPTSSSKISSPKKPPLCPWRAETGSFEATRLKMNSSSP